MIGIELYHSCFYGRYRPYFNPSGNWAFIAEEVPIPAETDS